MKVCLVEYKQLCLKHGKIWMKKTITIRRWENLRGNKLKQCRNIESPMKPQKLL